MAKKITLLSRLGNRKNPQESGPASSTEMLSADVSNAALELGVEVPDAPVSSHETDVVPPTGGDSARSLKSLLARARMLGRWTAFFGLVFSAFAWICMPTKAIAWRMSQVAKANGFIVEIDDVRIMPWGTINLENVAWHFPTKRSTDSPVPFVADSLSVRVAPLRFLLGEIVGSIDGEVDTGSLQGSFYRGGDGLKLELELEDVPLYALPKVQQSLNAPIRGELSLKIALSSPNETFSAASGEIRIKCANCKVGDGETKLFVPSASGMLANGMTVPEIDFGNINGAIVIEDGVGTAEEILSKSDDVTIMVYGSLVLAEPISKSDLDMRIKLFISPEMQTLNPDIGLMVATATTKTKLTGEDVGGLGYRLLGTFGRPKLRTFKYKSAKERRDERAEKAKETRARKGGSKSRSEAKTRSATRTPATKTPTKAAATERAEVEPVTAAVVEEAGEGLAVPDPTEAFLGAKGNPSIGGARDDGGRQPTIAVDSAAQPPEDESAEASEDGDDADSDEEPEGTSEADESSSGSGGSESSGDSDGDEE